MSVNGQFTNCVETLLTRFSQYEPTCQVR